MKIKVNGKEIEGTPTEVLMGLRNQAWDADEYKDAAAYLENLKETYRRMCDQDMVLPEGDMDTKAAAALKALAEIKLITIEEAEKHE